MLRTITNGVLTVSAASDGAELHSIKFEGVEYLWQCGDAWKRYAPVLFPFICSPKGKVYNAGGKEYTMPANHGFARDREFEEGEFTGSLMKFSLSSDEASRSVYPYDFRLEISYELGTGNESNVLFVRNKVINTGSEKMYFYLGGHPAFNCPLDEGLAFDDYYVEYSKPETIIQVWNGTRTILENQQKLLLTRALFDNDVIMKDAPVSDCVTLKSDKGSRGVSLSWDKNECGCISVWSPAGNDEAAFVCLEPWTSVPVYADDEFKDIEKKPHAIGLEAGKEFCFGYRIGVF